MCVNCMSHLDAVTISSVGAAGAARVALGRIRHAAARVGFDGRVRRQERAVTSDERVAEFLRALDLDPNDHVDLVSVRSTPSPVAVG